MKTPTKTARPKSAPAAAPRIVAFGGQKGGAGKTTTAIAVSVELHRRGRSVVLVDTDPQGSARTWADEAADKGIAGPTVVAMGAGLHQPGQLPDLASRYDVAIVDCPPRLDVIQRAVLMVCDLVVLPCGPGPMDAWAMAESMDLVVHARKLHPELDAKALITRRATGTVLGKEVRGVLERAGLPVLATVLGYRVDFQEAFAASMGPTTYHPKGAAAAEVRALVDELWGA